MAQNSPKKSNNFSATHGRRKEAVAKVRLYKGKGETTVNGISIINYFPGEVATASWQKPFVLTKTSGDYWASVKVSGSGKSSQLDAVIHGFSKTLILENSEFRLILKKAGLLTRDPRVKERRKYGLAQKARKGKQSPKR